MWGVNNNRIGVEDMNIVSHIHQHLLGCLGYNSLEVRREKHQLTIMCKIIRGKIYAPDLHRKIKIYVAYSLGLPHCAWRSFRTGNTASKTYFDNVAVDSFHNLFIQVVLFPLLSYSEADKLWNTDLHEHIRIKFDLIEVFISPVTAAQILVILCCKKRKDMLGRMIHIVKQVLTNQTGEYGPRQKDCAQHLMEHLKNLIIMKKLYKDDIDELLSGYVLRLFNNTISSTRVKACWLLHCFANFDFKNDQLLIQAVGLTVNALLNDDQLPVKVEAAIALQMLLTSQEKVHKYLEPQVSAVTLELLKVIRETENNNIASVLQKILPLYTEQLMPMAFEIMDHLATTFSNLIKTDSEDYEKEITGLGLLNTMGTVHTVMEGNPEIMAQLEKPMLRAVVHILPLNMYIECIEKAIALICNLTKKTISEEMWKVLELLYKFFEKNGFNYFTDMMPVLHNYITVDTNAFLSNDNHVCIMYKIVRAVLNSDYADVNKIEAAKLLEVMVLSCSGKIDIFLRAFVKLVLHRFTRRVLHSGFRIMLLQVLIAILVYKPQLLFMLLNKIQSQPNAYNAQHFNFIFQWIDDNEWFMGDHCRKIYVLGICTLLEMGPQRPNLQEVLPKLLSSCLMLLQVFEDDTDTDDEAEARSKSKDRADEKNKKYLTNLAWMAVKNYGINKPANEDSDDESDIYAAFDLSFQGYEQFTTPLDKKDCPVDEYIKFKDTLEALSTSEPALYHALTTALNEQEQQQLNAVFVLADQRKAQQDIKRIEQNANFKFAVPAPVSNKFKFGS